MVAGAFDRWADERPWLVDRRSFTSHLVDAFGFSSKLQAQAAESFANARAV